MTGTEYPTPELPDADADQAVVLGHVRRADVVFLAWLDAWIDKSIADGTLTPAKASAYREAIAARCAQLGEVPNIVGAVQRLDIKPGDTLVFVAPTDSVEIVHAMHRQVSAFLDGTGVRAMTVPPGTEIKVVHPGPRAWEYPVWSAPKDPAEGPALRVERFETGEGAVFKVTHLATGIATSARSKDEALSALNDLLPWEFKLQAPDSAIEEWAKRWVTEGVVTREEAMAKIRHEWAQEDALRRTGLPPFAKEALLEDGRQRRPIPPFASAESVVWPESERES